MFDATNAALAVGGVLLQRHTMIDHLLGEARCARVIELAAGLSRRGAAVSADPAVHYVEIDLPRAYLRCPVDFRKHLQA